MDHIGYTWIRKLPIHQKIQQEVNMQMIFFVLNDPDRLDPVLAAWENAGVKGVTLFETTGIHRRRKQRVPMRYVFSGTGPHEEGHVTLMAIVPDQEVVERCLSATEAVIGDLEKPDTGIFAAYPLTTVKGLNKSYR
jgi:hypothetical protein